MKHLLLLFVLIAFSCKKEDAPAPTSKAGHLEIEYKTVDTQMDLYYSLNNKPATDIEDTMASYYKLDTVVLGAQNYSCYISPKNTSYASSILVKFNGDTIKFEQGSSFAISGTLPFIP